MHPGSATNRASRAGCGWHLVGSENCGMLQVALLLRNLVPSGTFRPYPVVVIGYPCYYCSDLGSSKGMGSAFASSNLAAVVVRTFALSISFFKALISS